MTCEQVPDQAHLPIALVVATGHEAKIVRRALHKATVRKANGPNTQFTRFKVVLVGVGCSDLDSNRLTSAHAAIISTGFAGALRHGIESGTLLFPEEVKKSDNSTYNVDPDLQKKIENNLHADTVPTHIARGSLLHTDSLLATTDQKQRACEQSACIACDMESAALAVAAKHGGRPFACLRIVLDPADITIPDPIMELADLQTEPGAAAFLGAVLRHPGQLPATAAFLWHTFKASRALGRSVTNLVEGCCE